MTNVRDPRVHPEDTSSRSGSSLSQRSSCVLAASPTMRSRCTSARPRRHVRSVDAPRPVPVAPDEPASLGAMPCAFATPAP